MHGRISAKRACNSCGFTIKMSSRYHRLLIYDVKRTTKIDGMGPFDFAAEPRTKGSNYKILKERSKTSMRQHAFSISHE